MDYRQRNPQHFLQHLPETKQRSFLNELKGDYQEIILSYFTATAASSQKIDAFATKAFLADLSVSQVMEIHMELMDAFSKQLKLENRSDDVLLDYRITLIDTIGHLCELYRCAIPREP
ncbi:Circadian clock protein KaiA [uncultured Synechococcales cyanobacterium]|uniref:Circadian clock oscillator protein KaiA n=1 Tax=uncultured Synechococcales cyanobacterium TaxID=1936017 RepID=A0A6J4VWR5_9CYAN|nr:Circadian clock protein KaiA [uncultured Synechococcales cyanobacterium]